ncbi:MAG: hypothetical protein LBJ70_05930 [Holosporales bacterium]|nr:hypothetical protein [Holosporales bacterium]
MFVPALALMALGGSPSHGMKRTPPTPNPDMSQEFAGGGHGSSSGMVRIASPAEGYNQEERLQILNQLQRLIALRAPPGSDESISVGKIFESLEEIRQNLELEDADGQNTPKWLVNTLLNLHSAEFAMQQEQGIAPLYQPGGPGMRRRAQPSSQEMNELERSVSRMSPDERVTAVSGILGGLEGFFGERGMQVAPFTSLLGPFPQHLCSSKKSSSDAIMVRSDPQLPAKLLLAGDKGRLRMLQATHDVRNSVALFGSVSQPLEKAEQALTKTDQNVWTLLEDGVLLNLRCAEFAMQQEQGIQPRYNPDGPGMRRRVSPPVDEWKASILRMSSDELGEAASAILGNLQDWALRQEAKVPLEEETSQSSPDLASLAGEQNPQGESASLQEVQPSAEPQVE